MHRQVDEELRIMTTSCGDQFVGPAGGNSQSPKAPTRIERTTLASLPGPMRQVKSSAALPAV